MSALNSKPDSGGGKPEDIKKNPDNSNNEKDECIKYIEDNWTKCNNNGDSGLIRPTHLGQCIFHAFYGDAVDERGVLFCSNLEKKIKELKEFCVNRCNDLAKITDYKSYLGDEACIVMYSAFAFHWLCDMEEKDKKTVF